MAKTEFLVSHGKSGSFGRFVYEKGNLLKRGQPVVVETVQGLEIGEVLCPVGQTHSLVLKNTPLGKIHRLACEEDEIQAAQLKDLANRIYEEGVSKAQEFGLRILDAEVLFDRRHVILQVLAKPDCYFDPLIQDLERQFQIFIRVENLAESFSTENSDEDSGGGCGQPGCGRESGGCSSCGSGGCSSCGKGNVELREYFAHLRNEMEHHYQRTSLL